MSTPLRQEAETNKRVEVLNESEDWPFDANGNLV
jgi:hypothetical protein